MAAQPSIPKGTRDFSPVEMAKRKYIFNTIRGVYHLCGFQEIETPSMEMLSTLMGNMAMRVTNFYLRFRTPEIIFPASRMKSY